MSTAGRRSRNSLASASEGTPVAAASKTATNHRACKRKDQVEANDPSISFSENVAVVFKGSDRLRNNSVLDTKERRASKLLRLESTESIGDAGHSPAAVASTSRSVRSVAVRAQNKRRQSARLSQNFKADLGNRRQSLAIGGNQTEIQTGSAVSSNQELIENSEIQHQSSSLMQHNQHHHQQQQSAGLLQHQLQQSALLSQQRQQQQLGLGSNNLAQQYEISGQQFVGQNRHVSNHQAQAHPLPYHRSNASQPLDDVTAALLNNDAASAASRNGCHINNNCINTGLNEQQKQFQYMQQQNQCLVQQQIHRQQNVQENLYDAANALLLSEESFQQQCHITQQQTSHNSLQEQQLHEGHHQQLQSDNSSISSNYVCESTGNSASEPYNSADVEMAESVRLHKERARTPDTPIEEFDEPRVDEGSSSPVVSVRRRPSPLPPLTWADKEQVWQLMCAKDLQYKRCPNMLDNHKAIHHRMRSILLDWISEVCEVYKMHRETYYLAIEYIDRYLLVTKSVPKQQLQLLGIACLFVAAKIEEIYPPKINEFSYVTDGACQEGDILEKELLVIKTLSWNLSPITCNTWLNTYLQLLQELAGIGFTSAAKFATSTLVVDSEFVYQRFSGETFVQICRLMDLCILETSCLQFSPSLLAASAVSYFLGNHVAKRLSGFIDDELQPVQRWMKGFVLAIEGLKEPAPLKVFSGVAPDDNHNIQTKSVELDTLEIAKCHLARITREHEQLLQQEQANRRESLHLLNTTCNRNKKQQSPQCPSLSVLTPPKTDEKKDDHLLTDGTQI